MIRKILALLLLLPITAGAQCFNTTTTDQYTYFVAVDSTDFTTRETGLSSFTVYFSQDGGTSTAMTTPTINETDATFQPGVYELLMDEGTTIGSGNDMEKVVYHITHAGMAAVSKEECLQRRAVTPGEALIVSSGAADAAVTSMGANTITAASLAADAGTELGTASWATTVRVLSASTNLNDLDAAGIRTAVGLASADLDTQLAALPTAAEVTADLLAATIDGTIDLQCALALAASYTSGKWTQTGAVVTYRNPGDSADRIVGTIGATSFDTITLTCP